jgi:hypothetical protein
MEVGRNVSQGFAAGVNNSARLPQMAVAGMAGSLPNNGAFRPTSTNTSDNRITVEIGTMQIGSHEDIRQRISQVASGAIDIGQRVARRGGL